MKSFEILYVLFNVVRTNDHPQFQIFGRVEECTRKNGGIEIHYGGWECHPLGRSPIFVVENGHLNLNKTLILLITLKYN
jgi:hypothetical protein